MPAQAASRPAARTAGATRAGDYLFDLGIEIKAK
jgi:hypothetical protein